MTDVGSIGGGWLSGRLIKSGFGVFSARKLALLACACCTVPVFLAPSVGSIWAATLLIGLAMAAHQGFSANLFTLVSDTMPKDAVAGAVGLVAAADFAMASEEAHFSLPEIDVGLFPYMALAPLVRVLGRRHALDLALTGRRIDAQQALRIGLVNEVVPASGLVARAEAILKTIASNAPIAVKLSLEAVNKGLDTSQSEGFALEASYFGLCAGTEDKKEGVDAFVNKRKAVFKGR